MTLRKLPAAPLAARVPTVRSEISQLAEQRFNPALQASAEEVASISILDVIGQDFWGEGVTAKRVAGILRNIGPKPVDVLINSPGGDVFEGLAIYNQLREHPAKVTVKVLGLAASAASIIAMAGDEIQIARAGFLMIHNVWVVASGDQVALREAADMLEPFDAALADIYAARSGDDPAEVRAMMNKETWLGGQAAIDAGLADTFLSADQVKVGEGEGEGVSALRRLDKALAEGRSVPRAERRGLIKEIFGKPGAAEEGKPGAADPKAEDEESFMLRLLALKTKLIRS